MMPTLYALVCIACAAVAAFSAMMLCWMGLLGEPGSWRRTLKLLAMVAASLAFGFMVYGGEL